MMDIGKLNESDSVTHGNVLIVMFGVLCCVYFRYVFNDFVIRPSNGFEATTFKYIWKQPSAVIYRLMAPASSQEATQHLLPIHAQKAQHLLNNPFRNDQILYTPVPSLSLRYEQQYQVHTSFQSLSPNEIVDSNFLAAIDCEFVSVQPELTEFDEHGDTVVVRPARLTLARVSVTRGQGPMIGIPFIDDYIARYVKHHLYTLIIPMHIMFIIVCLLFV